MPKQYYAKLEEINPILKNLAKRINESYKEEDQKQIFPQVNQALSELEPYYKDEKETSEEAVFTKKNINQYPILLKLFQGYKKKDKNYNSTDVSESLYALSKQVDQEAGQFTEVVSKLQNAIRTAGLDIADKLLEYELTNEFYNIEEIDNSLVKQLKNELNNLGNEKTSYLNEIRSVYLRYFEYDYDADKEDPNVKIINEDGKIDFKVLNERIAESSAVLTKTTKKAAKGNKKEETWKIGPMFSVNKKGKLKAKAAAAKGGVDSFYFSRKERKIIGTSTTGDNTGEIESTQFLRHHYKTIAFQEFAEKHPNWEDANSMTDIINFQNRRNNKVDTDQMIEIQKLQNEETFKAIIDRYCNGGPITVEVIEKMFEATGYKFDTFGGITTQKTKGLQKVMDMYMFFDYQNYLDNSDYPKEVIEKWHELASGQNKNYNIFSSMQEYEPEKLSELFHKQNKLSIEMLENVFGDPEKKQIILKLFSEDSSLKTNKIMENEEYAKVIIDITETFQSQIEENQELYAEIGETLVDKGRLKGQLEERLTGSTSQQEVIHMLRILTSKGDNNCNKIFNQIMTYQDKNKDAPYLTSLRKEFKSQGNYKLASSSFKTVNKMVEKKKELVEKNKELKEEIAEKDRIQAEKEFENMQKWEQAGALELDDYSEVQLEEYPRWKELKTKTIGDSLVADNLIDKIIGGEISISSLKSYIANEPETIKKVKELVTEAQDGIIERAIAMEESGEIVLNEEYTTRLCKTFKNLDSLLSSESCYKCPKEFLEEISKIKDVKKASEKKPLVVSKTNKMN
jgi:hypothetical protein